MFLATMVVFGIFIVFYYSIGRLYILRWDISFGKISNVLYSPPRMSLFFVINACVSAICVLFYLADFVADLAEKKFKEKKEKPLNFKKVELVPILYVFSFAGFLFASSYLINRIEENSPIIVEQRVLDLINEYRDRFKKEAYEESEFSCQMALDKLEQIGTSQIGGLGVGGEAFKEEDGILYAYSFVKNVGREEQVLYWWQQNLDLNNTLQVTNVLGREITKACVRADYGKDYSTVVLVVSSL